jgi:hypothetical protein
MNACLPVGRLPCNDYGFASLREGFLRLNDERNEGTNNRSPVKKLACVETSNAKQAKIKIITASIYRNETGLFFILLFEKSIQ